MKYLQVTVIAQAQCRYFASNIQYIESFHWASEANDRGNLRCGIVDINQERYIIWKKGTTVFGRQGWDRFTTIIFGHDGEQQ